MSHTDFTIEQLTFFRVGTDRNRRSPGRLMVEGKVIGQHSPATTADVLAYCRAVDGSE